MLLTDVRGNTVSIRVSDHWKEEGPETKVLALYPCGRLHKRTRERYVVHGAPPGSMAELLLLRKKFERLTHRDDLDVCLFHHYLWKRTMEEHCPHCVYCGTELTSEQITIDHWWPSVKGGPHSPLNWVPSCLKCNLSKKEIVIIRRPPKYSPAWMRANLAVVLSRLHSKEWVGRRLVSWNVGDAQLEWLESKDVRVIN